MPEYTGLNTEHIKSHLQKYRIHRERSKEEFLEFFEQYMLNPFSVWEAKRGWELDGDTKPLEGGVREYEEGQGQGRSSHASLMPIPPQQRAHRGGNAGSAGSLAAAAAAREILQESEAMVRELRGICQEVAEKGQRMQAALERFVGSGSSSSGMGMGAVVSVGAMAGMGVDGGGGFAQHNLHGVENARFGAVGRPMTLPMPGAHASSAHFPLAAGMHPGAQGMGAGASSRPGVGSCALNPR
ncbi:hypothetical protein B484DRAFT_189163 [Ochromonadaceae sp. CCMP2298]|nr:hypothetical protein B484DRAFT_189163 [Ochromonadaceae sp. CCMP2298]